MRWVETGDLDGILVVSGGLSEVRWRAHRLKWYGRDCLTMELPRAIADTRGLTRCREANTHQARPRVQRRLRFSCERPRDASGVRSIPRSFQKRSRLVAGRSPPDTRVSPRVSALARELYPREAIPPVAIQRATHETVGFCSASNTICIPISPNGINSPIERRRVRMGKDRRYATQHPTTTADSITKSHTGCA